MRLGKSDPTTLILLQYTTMYIDHACQVASRNNKEV